VAFFLAIAALVLEVLGEVDGGHPAAAEFAVNCVALGKGDPEAGECFCLIHGRTIPV
jgi:hypothetical protein